jgi:dipeptidyl aminopeptidase/acylaminoacyl peptidase
MKKLLLLLSCILAFHLSVSGQKPMTHEIMIKLKKVGAPKISPNGRFVIYSRVETSYNLEEQTSDLWIALTDGSTEPRKLTNTKGGEDNYQWSPTSDRIYFTAKRDGDEAPQLYVLSLAGGEAQRLTNLSTGLSDVKFSADGSRILFSSRVLPTAFTDSASKKLAEEKKKIKTKARVYQSFPVRYWDAWLDEKQGHIFTMELHSGAQPLNLMKEVSLVQSPGFRLGSFDFGPDGKSVVFTATTEYHTTAYQSAKSNIYTLSLFGGKESVLVNDETDYGAVSYTEDGKYLVATGSAIGNKLYYLNRIYRFDVQNHLAKKELAATLDRPMNDMEIAGSSIFASIEDQGVDRIVEISIADGSVKSLLGNETGSFAGLSLSANPQLFAYQYQNLASPPEVWVSNNGSLKAISKANDAVLAGLDLQKPEVIWTKSSRGKNIRSIVLKPSSFDASKKYPLFVLMHGGPASSFKDVFGYRWNPYILGSAGYVIVMTDYTGSVGYGEKFAQDIQFDPFKGPGQEIQEAAADAIKRFSYIDGSKQAAGGASYGGHLANWMQATTSHYKCLISHAGLVNSEAQWGTSDVIWGRELMNGGAPWVPTKTWKEQNPMRFAANFKTPMLLTVGENDYRVPINNTLENWSIHQRLQVPSKLIVFPGENHWILNPDNSKFHYSEIQNWLATYLK